MTAASREEDSEQSADSQPALSRRTVVKALGAGAALSALSGPAFAQSQQGNPDIVRRRFGYTALTSRKPPIEPDHEVELHVRAPSKGFKQGQWFFDPTGLFIQPGDTVRFTTKREIHTISSYHPVFGYKRRIPRTAPVISSPVVWPDTYFLYTFEQEGVYDLMCLPHEFLGMVVRLVCGSPTGPGAEPISPPEEKQGATLFPPSAVGARVLKVPALRPERIVEAGTVQWDDIAPEHRREPHSSGGGH